MNDRNQNEAENPDQRVQRLLNNNLFQQLIGRAGRELFQNNLYHHVEPPPNDTFEYVPEGFRTYYDDVYRLPYNEWLAQYQNVPIDTEYPSKNPDFFSISGSYIAKPTPAPFKRCSCCDVVLPQDAPPLRFHLGSWFFGRRIKRVPLERNTDGSFPFCETCAILINDILTSFDPDSAISLFYVSAVVGANSYFPGYSSTHYADYPLSMLSTGLKVLLTKDWREYGFTPGSIFDPYSRFLSRNYEGREVPPDFVKFADVDWNLLTDIYRRVFSHTLNNDLTLLYRVSVRKDIRQVSINVRNSTFPNASTDIPYSYKSYEPTGRVRDGSTLLDNAGWFKIPYQELDWFFEFPEYFYGVILPGLNLASDYGSLMLEFNNWKYSSYLFNNAPGRSSLLEERDVQ